MVENHLLDLDPLDPVELAGQLHRVAFASGHFQQDQAVGAALIFVRIVEPQPGLDRTAVFREKLLNLSRMLDAIGDMHAENNMSLVGHIFSLPFFEGKICRIGAGGKR